MNETTPPGVMEVRSSREGPVAILTIDNQARKNALSLAIRQGLVAHLRALNVDPTCRAIVITGAGGFFSAGGDVKTMRDRGERDTTTEGVIDRRINLAESQEMARLLLNGPKPVITAVEGFAYGAGLALAMSSDYTVAARDARFCAAQVLRGLSPDGSLYYVMAMRAGPGRARDLLLSGRVIDGAQAERYGVVHELVESGGALQRAIDYARQFARIPPLAVAAVRAALTDSYQALEACHRAERDIAPLLSGSAEHREAVRAFLEKREPVFD